MIMKFMNYLKNSLIKEKIKKIELEKNFKEIIIEDSILII